MIYVRLAGGVGNQLYQLAAAEIFSQRYDMKYCPVLGGLTRYAVSRAPDSLRIFSSPRMALMPAPWLQEFMSDRMRVGRWIPVSGINDRNVENIPRSRGALVKNLYLDGYFQDCWNIGLFDRAMNGIDILPFNESECVGGGARFCAIHIRGGDFLKIPLHQVVGPDYYLRCVQSAVESGVNDFQVVTDDPAYASGIISMMSNVLKGVYFNIRIGQSALSDFHFLRNSPARIIGNSTFAWWAAALDSRRSPTWSPDNFIAARRRNFFLPWEKVTVHSANS